jgi:outer membrane protein assembly factor BamD (BamD/ComL family)
MRTVRLVLLACCVTVCFHSVALGQSQAVSDPAFQEEYTKGKEALNAHKYENAISAFKKANKLHQNKCADCYYGMAMAYLHTQEVDHALENADRALARTGADVSRAITHNLKGNIYLAVGRNEPQKTEKCRRRVSASRAA